MPSKLALLTKFFGGSIMKCFELLNANIVPVIIKEKKKIIDIIRTANNMCTERRARDYVNYFSSLLSAMASSNPYFYIKICRNDLGIPEELWDICRKMAHFVLSENYFIIRTSQISQKHEMEHSEWDYEIPLLFMPVLFSFIKAIQKVRIKPEKNPDHTPVFTFFAHLDKSLSECPFEDILKNYSCKNRTSLMEVYREWINTYLGRKFFIHYEEFFNECAKSQHERKLLYDATAQLTNMAAPTIGYNKVPSELDMGELDRRLVEYKDALKKALENGNPLFDRVSYILTSETTCLKEICVQFQASMQQLSSKIQKYIIREHKPDSLYKIAVKNPDNLEVFENQIANYMNDIKAKIIGEIQNYYMNLVPSKTSKDVALQKLYDSNILFFEYENNKHKMDRLSFIFQQTLEDISKNMKKFFNNVKKSSSDDSSSLSAKTTEKRFKQIWIIDEINEIKEGTIEKIEAENLVKNFPSLYQHPYIYQIGYPLGTEIILPSDSLQINNDASESNT